MGGSLFPSGRWGQAQSMPVTAFFCNITNNDSCMARDQDTHHPCDCWRFDIYNIKNDDICKDRELDTHHPCDC